jgi:hypothetical protein
MLEKLGAMLIDLVKYALTGLFIFLPIGGWLGMVVLDPGIGNMWTAVNK